jgi:hypothetical protein
MTHSPVQTGHWQTIVLLLSFLRRPWQPIALKSGQIKLPHNPIEGIEDQTYKIRLLEIGDGT